MLLHLAGVVFGGAFLYLGAEWLVRGAAGLARAFGVRPLIVGLTVVAYATSAPEVVVSTLAALDGRSAMALGNVIGSNIANLGLILGITAALSPFRVEGQLVRRELPVLVAATALLPLLLLDARISRIEGGLSVLASMALTVLAVRGSQQNVPLPAVADAPAPDTGRLKLALIALAGLGLLIVGGKILVDGASGVAAALGLSERVIGLTIVAIGTSLPELATSLVAARRGHTALAVGNVIGSNVFNVLFVLGSASAIQPITGALAALQLDLYVLGGTTVFAVAMLRRERVVRRVEGSALAVSYLGFLAWLAAS